MNDNHEIHLQLHQDAVFYGDGLFDTLLLDPRKYKGKGRPRKTDYSPFKEIQRYLNELRSKHIEEHRQYINK